MLSNHPDVVAATSAVVAEGLLCDRGRRLPRRTVDASLAALAPFRQAGVAVLAVDYVSKRRTRADFERRARSLGIVPFAAHRMLDGR